MSNISDDPIFDSYKQGPLSNLQENIEDMFGTSIRGDQFISEEIIGITAEEIGDFLDRLINGQSTTLKSPILTKAPIKEELLFAEICQKYKVVRARYDQKASVYFLESEEFGIAIVPINIGERKTSLSIQPLEETPKCILNLWGSHRVPSKINIKPENIPGVTRGFPAKK